MLRRQASYPPYYYTVRLMASHPEEAKAARQWQISMAA